jgi:hypothetical protein
MILPKGVKLSRKAMKRKLPEEAMEYFREQGAKGGKAGAKARMDKLTPAQRSAIAKKAAAARWSKVKDGKS